MTDIQIGISAIKGIFAVEQREIFRNRQVQLHHSYYTQGVPEKKIESHCFKLWNEIHFFYFVPLSLKKRLFINIKVIPRSSLLLLLFS